MLYKYINLLWAFYNKVNDLYIVNSDFVQLASGNTYLFKMERMTHLQTMFTVIESFVFHVNGCVCFI